VLLPVLLPAAGRAAIMQQVPEQQGGFVRVPKISTGADSAAASATSSMDSSAATASTASWSSSEEEAAAAADAGADVSGPISDDELAALQALDVRVGRIISCERHPDADRWGGGAAQCKDSSSWRAFTACTLHAAESALKMANSCSTVCQLL
jgi:hypothetical protein